MGVYSWLTSDTEESVLHIPSGCPQATHYLLQPGKLPHIVAELYDGYGNFGYAAINAHRWLAEINAPALGLDLSDLSDEELHSIGVTLAMGDVMIHAETGDLYWIWVHKIFESLGGTLLPGNYATQQLGLGGSVNDLLERGELIARPVAEHFSLPYPIKISRSPEAVYEDLPAAKHCPNQGYPEDEADPDWPMDNEDDLNELVFE